MERKFRSIGNPVQRQDGRAKVTGQALFADDINLPNQLFGVMVRSPTVHGRIQSVDFSPVVADPGLVTICTASDIPGDKKIGALRPDQPIFCDDRIVTAGDVVAMLVGDAPSHLVDLARRVRVDVEPLPVLTDPQRALELDVPLIHPEFKTNLIVAYPLRKGDVDRGFAGCDCIIEQTYTTPLVEHAYLETETVLALLEPGGRNMRIIGSVQNPYTCRRIVARVLGWPLARVRVVQAELGGSFGGKDDCMNVLAARAAVAALKTGRPVKIRYDRESSILESYKRHPYVMKYKVGFNRDGRIKAMKIDFWVDGGAYASMSPFVTWRSVVQATGPYDIEHVWTDVRAVYTNNPYTGAFRGFGSPQPIFAQESLMDEIAVKLGMTPSEIRRINGLRRGSVTASGQTLKDHDVTYLTVLDRAVRRTDFDRKWREHAAREPAPSRKSRGAPTSSQPDDLIVAADALVPPEATWRRGIGLATSYRGCALGAEGIDAAAAYLSLQQDGSATLLSGLAENGQGLRTTFCMIAAEVLGIDPERITYLEMDTGLVADSGPTVASRSTVMGGSATKAAAETLRGRLAEVARAHWKVDSEIVFDRNRVFPADGSNREVAFGTLCDLAYSKGTSLSTIGWYRGPHVDWDEETGQGSAYFTYVYGCQVAEVRVNVVTGEVYIDRVTAVHDPGKVINLLGAEGQVYGGVTQGAGFGLWEEISTHQGKPRELNLDQYVIPTSKDLGEIEAVFVEGRDTYGPWGAKSLGEPTLELTAAAIANAVANALGRRCHHLPLNLEEVVLGRKLRPEDLERGSG